MQALQSFGLPTEAGEHMNAPMITPTVQHYVDRLTPLYNGMKASVIESGKILIEAKAKLPHGEFYTMLQWCLPFTPAQAQMFMRVARNPELANPRNSEHLPTSASTLEVLAKLPAERFDAALVTGKIHRRMTAEDAKALLGPPAREPIPVQARDGEDLYQPCFGHTDILATLKGYRVRMGMSQLEMDERANLQSGYCGKIEVQIKPLTMDSMIDEASALGLAIWVLPAKARVTVLA